MFGETSESLRFFSLFSVKIILFVFSLSLFSAIIAFSSVRRGESSHSILPFLNGRKRCFIIFSKLRYGRERKEKQQTDTIVDSPASREWERYCNNISEACWFLQESRESSLRRRLPQLCVLQRESPRAIARCGNFSGKTKSFRCREDSAQSSVIQRESPAKLARLANFAEKAANYNF